MGAIHFLMKTLPKVAAEMALHVLAYNLTRVLNIIGIKPLIAAIRAEKLWLAPASCHQAIQGPTAALLHDQDPKLTWCRLSSASSGYAHLQGRIEDEPRERQGVRG